MKTPDCIQRICLEFRKLFSSDEGMAHALRVEIGLVQQMMKGEAYPALDVMVEIQAALRQMALFKEQARAMHDRSGPVARRPVFS